MTDDDGHTWESNGESEEQGGAKMDIDEADLKGNMRKSGQARKTPPPTLKAPKAPPRKKKTQKLKLKGKSSSIVQPQQFHTCHNILATITSKDRYVNFCFYKAQFLTKVSQQRAKAARPKELMFPMMAAQISRWYTSLAHLWPIIH